MARRYGLLMVTALASMFGATLWGQTKTPDTPPSQRELNGFLLGQYLTVPADLYGKPIREVKAEDGSVNRAYWVDEGHKTYMAFDSTVEDPTRMFSIQLAGEPNPSLRPFLGLHLGDSKQQVVRLLGQPSSATKESDFPATLYSYEGRNYSVELDEHDQLSSIRISGYEGFDKKMELLADLKRFELSVKNHDLNTLLDQLAGDLEIYRADKVISFSQSGRKELANPHSPITTAILGPGLSVREVYVSERTAGEGVIRVRTEGPLGYVLKFPKSKILAEIAFDFQAGHWRVYEIRFRSATNSK